MTNTTTKRMPIAKVRDIIKACDWAVSDLQGATPAEFTRMNVPERLQRHIAEVDAAADHIPDTMRFAGDVRKAANAITRAKLCIQKWQDLQPKPTAEAMQKLRDERDQLLAVLSSISLGSTNSMTTKEDLGRQARKALVQFEQPPF